MFYDLLFNQNLAKTKIYNFYTISKRQLEQITKDNK